MCLENYGNLVVVQQGFDLSNFLSKWIIRHVWQSAAHSPHPSGTSLIPKRHQDGNFFLLAYVFKLSGLLHDLRIFSLEVVSVI